MTGIWAAVPVKGFSGAKQRLAPVLSPAHRQALAAAMLEDVLEALARVPLAGIIVNTADPEAAALVSRYGARVVTHRAREGHTQAVAVMASILAAKGAEAMLTVPGDIPRATSSELAELCRAHRPAPSFTIAPARDRRGSNAVLISPPDAVPLRFGEDSFYPHLEMARRWGLEPTVLALPGIGLDLDQPADLQAFMKARPGMQTRSLALLRAFIGVEEKSVCPAGR